MPTDSPDAGPDVDANVGADGDGVGADADTDGGTVDATEVCYLGEESTYDLCLPTVSATDLVDPESEYFYEPLPGDAQYRAPARFLDLAALDPGLLLGPHFALWELAEEADGRYAIVSPALIERLEAVRADIDAPIYITSGYRSPAHNGAVGGVMYSRHMWGDATDMSVSEVTLEMLDLACIDHEAAYTDIYDDGHVHCDWRDDALDPIFFAESTP